MTEVYLSTDVEADGPIPGPHSMLSFASVAFSDTGVEIGEFSANLHTLPGAEPHPKTQEWWARNPEAYRATRVNLRDPEEALRAYHSWMKQLPGQPVFVGYPVTYDFLFVYWYLMRFVGDSPFSHSGWDIKTAVAIALRSPYRAVGKRRIPRDWFGPGKHTHVASDDAREQGQLHVNVLKQLGLMQEPS